MNTFHHRHDAKPPVSDSAAHRPLALCAIFIAPPIAGRWLTAHRSAAVARLDATISHVVSRHDSAAATARAAIAHWRIPNTY